MAAPFQWLLSGLNIFTGCTLWKNDCPFLLIQVKLPEVIELLIFKSPASKDVHAPLIDACRVPVPRARPVTLLGYLGPCLASEVISYQGVAVDTGNESSENEHEPLFLK